MDYVYKWRIKLSISCYLSCENDVILWMQAWNDYLLLTPKLLCSSCSPKARFCRKPVWLFRHHCRLLHLIIKHRQTQSTCNKSPPEVVTLTSHLFHILLEMSHLILIGQKSCHQKAHFSPQTKQMRLWPTCSSGWSSTRNDIASRAEHFANPTYPQHVNMHIWPNKTGSVLFIYVYICVYVYI